MTRARAAVLVLAGLTLAACGSIHPGDAAVVDGQSISMQQLNRTAEAYCTLTARSAAEQGASKPDNADIRRQAVTSLVSLVVARKLAIDEDVKVKPSSFELTGEQEDQIAKAFPSGDTAQISRAIEESQEISQIAVGLGEKSTGQTRTSTNEAQLAEAGQALIVKAFKDNDVRFAPRFGLSSTTKPVADTGSLSVAGSDLGDPEQLPPAQRCS
jgi:hypothetical protein